MSSSSKGKLSSEGYAEANSIDDMLPHYSPPAGMNPEDPWKPLRSGGLQRAGDRNRNPSYEETDYAYAEAPSEFIANDAGEPPSSKKRKKNAHGSVQQKADEDMQLPGRQTYALEEPHAGIVDPLLQPEFFAMPQERNMQWMESNYVDHTYGSLSAGVDHDFAAAVFSPSSAVDRHSTSRTGTLQPRVCSSLLLDSRLLDRDALDSLNVEYSCSPGSREYELKNVPETVIDDIIESVCFAEQLSEFPLPWKLATYGDEPTVLLIEPDVKESFSTFLQAGNENECVYILDRCLSLVAQDELAWLSELSSLDLPSRDLVQILMDESCDEPWTRSNWQEAEIRGPRYYRDPDATFHRSGCPHLREGGAAHDTSPGLEHWSQSALHHLRVSQICGLAGIRNHELRPGNEDSKANPGESVDFSSDHFYAKVTYPTDFNYLHKCIDSIRHAVAYLQAMGLCCNGWTIILDSSWTSYEAHPGDNVPLLQMRRIDVRQVQQLESVLYLISGAEELYESLYNQVLLQISHTTCSISSTLAEEGTPTSTYNHLRTIFDDSRSDRFFDDLLSDSSNFDCHEEHVAHLVSLTVQMLSLSLVSFASSHIGTLELDCLAEDLKQVTLLGCYPTTNVVVEMKLRHLTCLEGLFRKPARVFSISKIHYFAKRQRKDAHEPGFLDWQRHDLRATPEDIVDTFGGSLITIEESVEPGTCLAFSLGGGIVAPTFASTLKSHWSSDLHLQYTPRCFRKAEMIMVGALSENTHCRRDPQASRSQACTRLQGLGTYQAFWQFSEIEVGFQGGQYFNLTGSANFSRVAGVTLKENLRCKAIARKLKWPDLEIPLGLQISFDPYHWLSHVLRYPLG
ncbi:hypothetical protein MBLNU457_7087t1 [Dothideomycetes sp. NU457]